MERPADRGWIPVIPLPSRWPYVPGKNGRGPVTADTVVTVHGGLDAAGDDDDQKRSGVWPSTDVGRPSTTCVRANWGAPPRVDAADTVYFCRAVQRTFHLLRLRDGDTTYLHSTVVHGRRVGGGGGGGGP